MAEVTLSVKPDLAALDWIEARLRQLGARPLAKNQGVAGSVEAIWRTWRWPNGETVELWSDNYSALSIAGGDARIAELSAAFREEYGGG